MKDAIDERNVREATQRNIIKWWNVNFVREDGSSKASFGSQTNEVDELGDFFKMSDEEQERVKEIMSRLSEEARQDEYEKQMEIERVRQEREMSEKRFNATTNSMSGDYGKTPVDDEDELARIQAILGAKDSAMRNTIELASHQ